MAVQMGCAAAGARSGEGPDGGLGGPECASGRDMIISAERVPRALGKAGTVTVRGLRR